MLKQLRVSAEADKLDDVALRVEPHQQEVTLYVAFHATLVLPQQHVRLILRRDGLFVPKHPKNLFQGIQFLGLVLIPFEIFSILSGRLEILHSSSLRMSSNISSTLL